MITVRQCKEVDSDHKRSCRQYAHTYHYKNTICVSKEWDTLPLNHKVGLIIHEVGHILVGKVEHKESQADKEAKMFFGVRVLYKDSKHGKRLQYLGKKDMKVVHKWIQHYINTIKGERSVITLLPLSLCPVSILFHITPTL